MLVALVLLAILTIGAVSASDDVLAVSDDGDSIESSIDGVDLLSDDDDDGDGDDDGPEEDEGSPDDDSWEPGDEYEDDFGSVWVYEGDDEEYNITDPDDLEKHFACASVPEGFNGSVAILTYDEDDNPTIFFDKELSEITDSDYDFDEGCMVYYIPLIELNSLEEFIECGWFRILLSIEDDDEGIVVDDPEYTIEVDGDIVRFWYDFGDDDDDDDEDYYGSVGVYEGDESEYNITDPESLGEFFAYASVPDGLEGSVAILTYDGDDNEIIFFNKDLSEITASYYDDEEGCMVYYIPLSELDNLEEFIEYESFTISLSVEDEEYGVFEVDEQYTIEVDDEGIVRFWYDDGEGEEFYGEGERIDAIFTSANLITNDIIVAIPKEDLPEDVDDEFLVIVPNEDDEDEEADPYETILSLSDLEIVDDYYLIYVGQLELPEIGESRDINLVVQFYSDGEEAYFAELGEDDDNLVVFTSPYINDEVFLLNDDWVISFRSFEDAADQFIVTVINEDEENFTIPFRFSAYDLDDEEFLGEITLSELNITKTGVYEILVNITDNEGKELAFASREVIVDTFDIMYDGPEDEESLSDVTRPIFVVKLQEDVTGFVKLYVDDDQVDEIDLADLYHSDVPPFNGRIIQLNDFAITDEGMHSIRVEVYDENGTPLKYSEEEVYIEVGENIVEFYNGGYGCEIGDVIEFEINSPLSDGAYFNISLNGKNAGTFTVAGGFDISDEYLDAFYDTFLLKPGFYEVEITFFDGEDEMYFADGEFTIGLLNLTLDKDVYYEGESATLTFEIEDPSTVYYELRPYYIYGAGPMGFDDNMIFNTLTGGEISEYWEDGKVTLVLEDLEAGNYYIYITYGPADDEDEYDYDYDYEDDINVIYYGGIIPITVLEQIEPEFELSINDGGSGTDAVVVVKANDGFNGNVSVKIGERDVPVTIVNGTGTVRVTGLSAQSYNATLSYNGSKAFKAAEANTNFRVKTVTSVIPTVVKVTTTYGTAKNIVVTLRDADGGFLANQTVTVTLNGNTYTGTTNANGQVSIAAVPSTLAVKSSYIATIAFAGDDNYSKSTGTVTVVVNKATPKFIAKAKKFKKSAKIKKYTVTLKTDKNVAIKYAKVTIKINKKTYTAKTNKYGKATFKIKKLTKKGKFKALLKYKGNSKFKAISKRVKITIK